jgi:hypothetical protein
MILVIRPDSWNFPLLVHVAGAMLLVAAVFVAMVALVQAWRDADPQVASTLVRFGFRTLLLAAIPSYFVMRIGAQWVASREYPDNVDLNWLGIGYAVGDFGGLLLLITTIVAGFAARRARAAAAVGGLARAVTVLTLVLVVAYGVAIWAMTAKPT